MGATDFATTAYGKTAADAYRSACEDALHENGHDPYNGTISTTSGFVEIPVSVFKGLTAKARYDILIFLAINEPNGLFLATKALSIRAARATHTEHIYKKFRSFSPARRALVERLLLTYGKEGEKWGNALCVDLGKTKGSPRGMHAFAFAGWAAM